MGVFEIFFFFFFFFETYNKLHAHPTKPKPKKKKRKKNPRPSHFTPVPIYESIVWNIKQKHASVGIHMTPRAIFKF